MSKLRGIGELEKECAAWRAEGKTVVWTNGCFDLFHAGHARALAKAREQGDILVVGINSDRSVRELKGPGRPLCREADRAEMLSALEAVDRVVVFDGKRCDRELALLKPRVWTKSGDYTPQSLDAAERDAVLANGGRIVITPLIPGVSTTLLVNAIRRLDPEKIVSAACVMIRDAAGRQLMVATRYADAVKWGLPGGGHRHGESLPETARREAREETGREVAIIRHMGVIERIDAVRGLHLAMHVFEAALIGGGETFAPEPGENIAEVAWFTPERLREEKRCVLGRRIWLEHGGAPDAWPPYILLSGDDE